jgi:hypothetical protein
MLRWRDFSNAAASSSIAERLEAAMSDARSVVIRPPIRFNQARPPAPDPDAPLKHVIDEYRHREQLVTCVCGWHGSTSTLRGERSPWDEHKASFRVPRRPS